MKCPECGTKLHEVVDSRVRPSGDIRRRRQCSNGHRFSTIETVAVLTAGGFRRRKQGKYPQELVNRCLADKAAGDSLSVVSDRRGVPEDTLRDWFYRGHRAPKESKDVKSDT